MAQQQWGATAWDDPEKALEPDYGFDTFNTGGTPTTAPTPTGSNDPYGVGSMVGAIRTGDGAPGTLGGPEDLAKVPKPTLPSGAASGVSGWDTPGASSSATPASGASSGFGEPAAPKASGAGDTVNKYTTQLQQLASTQDPRQKAVIQDQIGRSLFTELKGAGHDVSWDGDQMVIDGRRYVIGDGSTAGGGAPDVMPREAAAAPAPSAQTLAQGSMTYGGTGLPQANPMTFAGFNDDRALAGGDPNSAKDAFRRIIGSTGIDVRGLSKEQTGQVLAEQVVPALQAQGYPVEVIPGAYDQIRVFSNERGWETIDIVGNAGGGDSAQWVWGDLAGGWGAAPQGMGGAGGGTPLSAMPGTTGATGVQTGSTLPAPGAAPTVEGIGDLSLTGPGYEAPADITTEGLPNRSYEEILGGMGQYTPGTVTPQYQFDEFGDMTAGTEGDTQALMTRLLQNPESLDARTVDMLKAANREEQAAMDASVQEDLKGLGYDMGIDSSAWLGSERLAAKRSRDEAITRGNRGIDIEAAKVNQGDRRAAAQLGTAYEDSVGRRKLATAQAAEGNKQAASAQKLTADLANEQNVFNAASLKSNNAVAAARTQLEQAAALNDRLSLRESTKQAAAELGISRDKLVADFALQKASELTQRYGIDVSQYVDLTKLSTAHGEFKEDLLFRLMALQQEMELSYAQLGEGARQFDVGAGIDLAKLQQQADQFGVDAYYRAIGL